MSRTLHHLATRIFNTQLMILPAKLDAILFGHGRLGERFGLDAATVEEINIQAETSGKSLKTEPSFAPMAGFSSIARIPVMGVLVRRAGQMTPDSAELTSYEAIRADFKEALAAPEVIAIVFEIDSPGGEVAGAFDLADQIYNARFQKPIYAVINELGCSAAYLLASAAKKIYIPRTGEAGSVGVVSMHVDQSGFDEKVGVKITHIFAGAHKVDYSPHQELSPSALAAAQAGVDNVYEWFVGTVARNRNLDEEAVRKTEAGVFLGPDAVRLGLVDVVMSFDEALADIAADATTGKGGTKTMKTLGERMAAAMVGAAQEEIVTAMAALGYVPQAAAQAIDLEAVKAEAKKSAIAYAAEITEMCVAANQPQLAAGLISGMATIDAVKEALLTARADKDARQEIISVVNPTNVGEPNALLADADRRKREAEINPGRA